MDYFASIPSLSGGCLLLFQIFFIYLLLSHVAKQKQHIFVMNFRPSFSKMCNLHYCRNWCHPRRAHRDHQKPHVCGFDSRPEVSPWRTRHGISWRYVHLIWSLCADVRQIKTVCIYLNRLQLHGLWDVQTKPAFWAGGRPQAGIRGSEGQKRRAAAPHPEVQDRLHRICQEGKEVGCVLVPLIMCGVMPFKGKTVLTGFFPQVGWSSVSISGCSSGDPWSAAAGPGDAAAGEEVSKLWSGHGAEAEEGGKQVREKS